MIASPSPRVFGTVIVAVALALVGYRWDAAHASDLAFAAAIVFLLCAFDKLHWAIYALGLAVRFGDARTHGIPAPLLLSLIVIIGSLVGGAINERIRGPRMPVAVIAVICIAYVMLRAPSSHAGVVSASDFAALPIAICAMQVMTRCLTARTGLIKYFAAGTAVAVGQGLFEAYRATSSNYQSYAGLREFASSIGSSNYAAAIGIVPGLLFIGLSLNAARRPTRIVTVLLAIPFLAAPLYLGSRGGTVALLVGLVVALLRRGAVLSPSRSVRTRFLTVSAIAGVLGFAFASHWLVFSRLDGSDSSAGYLSGRAELWKSALEVIWRHPLFGLGPGGVTDYLLPQFGTAYAHNLWLNVLGQAGIFLGAAYLIATFPPLRAARYSPAFPALIGIYVDSMVEPFVTTADGVMLYAPILVVGCGYLVRSGVAANNAEESSKV